jgi:valyl-tRNA synthetase
VRSINILDAQGRVTLKGNVDFFEGLESDNDHARLIAAVDGQDRFVARTRIVEMMALAGLLAKIEPHAHAVPHGDRSNAVIEPWLTDQWYADAKTLAEPAIAAVREGKTQFVPKTWEKTYFDWLGNIQPWCISRQLWWGHQIPAWYAPWGAVFVEETEDVAYAAALADGVERGALAQAEADALAGDPARLAEMFKRDEDVLDTWFSSALWPFSTLGWPDETPELKRFYPTDALVTGFDIIFFWVARMMMMGLHFMEEVPFHDVYIHALVRDEKGAKMSKSKGNVIDPLDLINRFGADALRFTLAAMAAQGRDIKLSESRIEGYRNFATKLWNASRFAEMNGCVRLEDFDPSAVREPLNRWILGEAASAAVETAGAIEAYRFNDAANSAYRFVWSVFCDWHLELAKPVLQGAGADPAAKAETQATIAHVLDMIYAMLHPFMPFLTEELWAITGEAGPKRVGPLALGPWPAQGFEVDETVQAEIGWVVDLIAEVRSVRSEMGVAPSTQTPLILIAPSERAARSARAWSDSIGRLARVASIETVEAPPPGALLLVVRGETVALPLAGVVDLTAEKARLDREIAKEKLEIAKVESKLGNDDFVARAPEDVIAEHQDRLETFQARLVKLTGARERLERL